MVSSHTPRAGKAQGRYMGEIFRMEKSGDPMCQLSLVCWQWREILASHSCVLTSPMSWVGHIVATVKKACQPLYFLRGLMRFCILLNTSKRFIRCTVESIWAGCIMAWGDNSNTLESIDGREWGPSWTQPFTIKTILMMCCFKAAVPIMKDPLSLDHAHFLLRLLGRGIEA